MANRYKYIRKCYKDLSKMYKLLIKLHKTIDKTQSFLLSREQNKQNSINKQNRRRQIKKMDSSQTHKIRNLQFQKI